MSNFISLAVWTHSALLHCRDWQRERAAALTLENVHYIGSIPQDEVGKHYWNFAVNWMPYDTRHAFNLASCPTKIMDGLASGRPLLTTAVPECRLYPDWITIVGTAAKRCRRG